MFDKKVQGEALILDDEGAGHVIDTDLHGVDWDHHKYDPRYDPKLIRARNKQESSARTEALLNGAPAPVAAGVVRHIVSDEPRWNVPATCPECGARVDQSVAAFAAHPTCTYCAKPLPCEAVRDENY